MNDFLFGKGAVRELQDNRRATTEDVQRVAGASQPPAEFWSPYVIAAYLVYNNNNQQSRSSCVAESGDKVNEALSAWAQVPDEVADNKVIDYLFNEVDGRLAIKSEIRLKMRNYSPVFLYHEAKKADGLPRGSEGTYLVMAGKVGQTVGVCREDLWPSLNVSEELAKSRVPSEEAYQDARDNGMIVRYFEGANTLKGYRETMWSANAHCIVGGYDMGGGADLGVQPQKPPTEQPTNGHANCFFAWYDTYNVSIGSWGTEYGASIFLKIVADGEGKKFVRGTAQDHIVEITGCHILGASWFPKYAYRPIGLFDQKLPRDVEAKFEMLQTVREDVTGRVFAILGGQRYWITPGGVPGTMYELGRGKLWPDVPADQVPEAGRPDVRKYPLGGIWGNASFADYFKLITGQI